ncbi:hypothetical protein Bmyc01_39280 [Bacillus mycoides]|nr:hypothetical protein Bmyc01_39280 [Bacillus mycoides]
MGDIKVTPEQLRKVAWTIRSTITNATATQERLKRDIDMISSNWLGSTYMKFNMDFRDSSFKMAQFITILEPLEKFLLDSANKFEQVDNMDVAIAMASTILTGKPFKGDYKTLTGSTKVNTEDRYRIKTEGSLLEGEYELSENSKLGFKAGHAELEVGLPYKIDTIKEDVLTGKIFGAKGGVTGFEDSLSFKNPYVSEISVTQKFIDASVVYGVEDYTFKNDAEVTIQKYEAKLDRIDIPNIIPFFKDHDLEVRAEFGLGTFGYKFHVGQETGAYVGGGLFAKFKKRGEEE